MPIFYPNHFNMMVKARKRFGQHFLNDPTILESFQRAIAPQSTNHLVEIGPGHGALTDYLVGMTKQLDLIEVDRDLIPVLQKKYGTQATIYEKDALFFDFRQLNQGEKLRIVGNLPYNISTPLLFHLFEQLDVIQDMHFLLQKEVVDRLVASPGEHNYGRLSVMSQFYCHAIFLRTVPPEAFVPPPKVQSAFVRLTPRAQPLKVNSLTQLQAVVREAFNHRRKTLSNSIKKWISAEALMALGIDPKKRPQTLSVEDYIRISNAIRVE